MMSMATALKYAEIAFRSKILNVAEVIESKIMFYGGLVDIYTEKYTAKLYNVMPWLQGTYAGGLAEQIVSMVITIAIGAFIMFKVFSMMKDMAKTDNDTEALNFMSQLEGIAVPALIFLGFGAFIMAAVAILYMFKKNQ